MFCYFTIKSKYKMWPRDSKTLITLIKSIGFLWLLVAKWNVFNAFLLFSEEKWIDFLLLASFISLVKQATVVSLLFFSFDGWTQLSIKIEINRICTLKYTNFLWHKSAKRKENPSNSQCFKNYQKVLSHIVKLTISFLAQNPTRGQNNWI